MINTNTNLTKREQEILELIVEGLTDEQIAHELCFTIHNANAYRKKLFIKLEANNVAALVREAFRRGIVTLYAISELLFIVILFMVIV